MIIVLLGPPGSGKGTQGVTLSQKFSIPRIVAGDIMREKSKNDLEVKFILESGKLLPSVYVNKFVGEAIGGVVANFIGDLCYCIVDGYPRTIHQAEYLQEHYGSYGIFVLYLKASDDVLVNRLSHRLMCGKCGNIQSAANKDFICIKCGATSFIKRKDDDNHVIGSRIQEYKKNTEPLIDFYTKNNIISIIDAEKNVSDVHHSIVTVLSQNILDFSNLLLNK